MSTKRSYILKQTFSFQLQIFQYTWLFSTHKTLKGYKKKKNTEKVTVVSSNFLVWKFCGKAQFPYSFGRFAQNYAETCLSTKFPHQEIRWNYGIFCYSSAKRQGKAISPAAAQVFALFFFGSNRYYYKKFYSLGVLTKHLRNLSLSIIRIAIAKQRTI